MKVMFARFPFCRAEDPDVTDWLVTTVVSAKLDERITNIRRWRRDDTPITMSRNDCLEKALHQQVDLLLMVDSDMSPDAYLPSNPYRLGLDIHAKPFWNSSLDFAIEMREAGKPCVIGAPYCGPPPHENIYVFTWGNRQSDCPDEIDMSLEQYSREHAASMRGIQPAAALPTGLILIDMLTIQQLEHPRTYYEWDSTAESNKASTEDVTFTRDLSLAGVPIFCNWDAWAGHWKRKCVGKPQVLTPEVIGDRFRRAVLREQRNGQEEQLVYWKDGKAQEVLQ